MLHGYSGTDAVLYVQRCIYRYPPLYSLRFVISENSLYNLYSISLFAFESFSLDFNVCIVELQVSLEMNAVSWSTNKVLVVHKIKIE